MAKKITNTHTPQTKVRRRHKKRGLHIRKKLGPSLLIIAVSVSLVTINPSAPPSIKLKATQSWLKRATA